MAFTASTNEITTPLLTEVFNADSQLQTFGDTLPKGVTAYCEVQIGENAGIKVIFQEGVLDFEVPDQVSLTIGGLLSEIPGLNTVVMALPSPISDLLSTTCETMTFLPETSTLTVAAKLDQLTIIPNIMEVNNLQVDFVTVLKSTNGGLRTLAFTADWVLHETSIEIMVSYDRTSETVQLAAVPSDGLDIEGLINAVSGATVALPSAINSVKLTKIVGEKISNMFTIIFSGTIGNKAGVHVIFCLQVLYKVSSFQFQSLRGSVLAKEFLSKPLWTGHLTALLMLSVMLHISCWEELNSASRGQLQMHVHLQ